MTKHEFRQNILNQLRSVSSLEMARWSELIEKSLFDFLSVFSGLWGGFKPLRTEPQIQLLNTKNIQWAYPQTLPDQSLCYFKESTQFQKSALGVMEPANGHAVELS